MKIRDDGRRKLIEFRGDLPIFYRIIFLSLVPFSSYRKYNKKDISPFIFATRYNHCLRLILSRVSNVSTSFPVTLFQICTGDDCSDPHFCSCSHFRRTPAIWPIPYFWCRNK
jgi:hypothetical protein